MDNLIERGICVIHMTCLEQNLSKIIEESVDMLMRMINNNEVSDIELETKLIVGESTSRKS